MADLSSFKPDGPSGSEYNFKDATARAGIASSKTLKSSVVTVPDAAPINAEDITVDITPVQDLHGYDRPWAGGAWKNKLPLVLADIKSLNTTGTWSGNTYTYNGMTFEILTDSAGNVIGIKVNGTASGDARLQLYTAIIQATFILNGCPSGGSSSGYKLRVANSNNTAIGEDVGSGYIFSETKEYKISINVGGGTNVQSKTFYPMLRANGTDSTFAPYSNICPIEGRTGAELDRVGKNWVEDTLVGARLYSSGSIGADSNFSMQLVRVIQGLQYTVTVGGSDLVGGFFTSKPTVGSVTYNGTIIDSTNKTFTAPITGWFGFRSLVGDTTTQCELGSTATTYEPYQGQQYTASFGETVHGGKWHVTKGGTDKTHICKTLTTADLNIVYVSAASNSSSYYFNITNAFSSGQVANDASGMSDIGLWYTNLYSDKTVEGVSGSGSYASIRVNANRLSAATPEALKAWLPTTWQLYAKLNNPTTISTPKQNVPMLQGINTVSANCGDVSLKYQPDNVIGELKGEIRAVEAELAEVEENLEIVYEDHVANTSMGVIVDGYSVGDMPFSNALDIAKPGYTPIAVTDTSIVHSTVANQGDIATHCLLDVANNRVRFYVHVMNSAASLTIPPNSLTFRVAYKKA